MAENQCIRSVLIVTVWKQLIDTVHVFFFSADHVSVALLFAWSPLSDLDHSVPLYVCVR